MSEIRIVTQSGTIHRAFEEDGIRFSAESCNLQENETNPLTVIQPKDDGTFTFPPDSHGMQPCIRCFGQCGAVHGDDGKRCLNASGHNDPHRFEGRDG